MVQGCTLQKLCGHVAQYLSEAQIWRDRAKQHCAQKTTDLEELEVMTSSFARLLGASPSSFALDISLRFEKQDASHNQIVTFSWTDVEVRK